MSLGHPGPHSKFQTSLSTYKALHLHTQESSMRATFLIPHLREAMCFFLGLLLVCSVSSRLVLVTQMTGFVAAVRPSSGASCVALEVPVGWGLAGDGKGVPPWPQLLPCILCKQQLPTSFCTRRCQPGFSSCPLTLHFLLHLSLFLFTLLVGW